METNGAPAAVRHPVEATCEHLLPVALSPIRKTTTSFAAITREDATEGAHRRRMHYRLEGDVHWALMRHLRDDT